MEKNKICRRRKSETNHLQTYGSNNLFDFQHPNAAYLSWIKRIFMAFLRLSNACSCSKLELCFQVVSSSFPIEWFLYARRICIMYYCTSYNRYTTERFFNAGAVLLKVIGYKSNGLYYYSSSVVCNAIEHFLLNFHIPLVKFELLVTKACETCVKRTYTQRILSIN